MQRFEQTYIGGAFQPTHGREELRLFDPVTEEASGIVVLADEEDAARAVKSASMAFQTFSQSTKKERIELLHELSRAVETRADELTEATIAEYGGPIEQARWRAGLAAGNFKDAARILEDFPFSRKVGEAEVIAQPAGVAVHIVPWNSLYNAISVKMAGALAAGCPVIVKPSEYSARQNQVFTECLHAAGAPAGVINVVTGLGQVVGEALTSHPDVRKISFTGSTAVGKSILRGAVPSLKRVTLELGGKSPTIVLDDADLSTAAHAALSFGFLNNAQSCIAGTRILIPRAKAEAFSEAIKVALANVVVGDPRDPSTTLGPLVNRRQFERVQTYIQSGIKEGARLVAGGEGRPDGLHRGFFVKPTIFTNVTNDMVIAREEIFGPVLCIIPYDDEDHAVALANDTPYGLHAYVIGRDRGRAHRVAARLDAGRVAINTLRHEPLAPFGGFKESGIGREYGQYGIEDHLEIKAVIGS
ncbi:aldehyde dehydrogenase family protein [Microvirga rosea]|uniref:aldehyde dehydrogenase family protein n=1 Tax=Microvirga rosea TaxID=2715425 RepID=UPI001D0AAB01|nr:aldehyde dehydrogenase family protein [Microvirga rosea]MCB8823343.1 aldehyde dehydrogenase family protein [Microvirga rosea]